MALNLLANLLSASSVIPLLIIFVIGVIVAFRHVTASFSITALDTIIVPNDQAIWYRIIKVTASWGAYFLLVFLFSLACELKDVIYILYLILFLSIPASFILILALVGLIVYKKRKSKNDSYEFIHKNLILNVCALAFVAMMTACTGICTLVITNALPSKDPKLWINVFVFAAFTVVMFYLLTYDLPVKLGIKKLVKSTFCMETNSNGKMYMLRTMRNNMLLLGNEQTEITSEIFLMKDLINDKEYIITKKKV